IPNLNSCSGNLIRFPNVCGQPK
ncbi:unnamed protein product, partial [Leptidea sinapis]